MGHVVTVSDFTEADVEAGALTVELIARIWRDHHDCTWVSTGIDVVWSCGIIHPRPIHMQPTTRDRHLAALVMTQIEADHTMAAEVVARKGAEIERLRAAVDDLRADLDNAAEELVQASDLRDSANGRADTAEARLAAVAAAGENVGMHDAIRTYLEAHTYSTEVPDEGEAYIWCVCGWRSDDETNMGGAVRHLFTHLTNAMHTAVRNHLRAALSVDPAAHDTGATS